MWFNSGHSFGYSVSDAHWWLWNILLSERHWKRTQLQTVGAFVSLLCQYISQLSCKWGAVHRGIQREMSATERDLALPLCAHYTRQTLQTNKRMHPYSQYGSCSIVRNVNMEYTSPLKPFRFHQLCCFWHKQSHKAMSHGVGFTLNVHFKPPRH